MNAGEEEEEEEARVIERMNECEIMDENEGPKKGNATTSRDESNRDDDSTNDGLYRGPLTLDERVNLCLSIGEECIQPDELRRLLEKKLLARVAVFARARVGSSGVGSPET